MSGYKNYLGATILIVLINSLTNVHTAELLCYNGSMENPQRTPLESPLPLIQNISCIDTNRTTVIFVYGYNSTASKPEPVAVLSGYIERGGVNLLLLDWPKEAQIGPLGTALGYPRAVKNTEVIGKKFAKALITLSDAGLDFTKLHLVGHSLGAQICGIAGNYIRDKGKIVARITGLDPAKPLYEGLVALPNALDMNSASFVDIIHSDPGVHGVSESVGTADFWPNYKGHSGFQPGCKKVFFPLINREGRCSHDRCWEFFRESILNRFAFPAAGEPNYETWIARNGTTDRIAYMGEYVSLDARGNYYLVTNAEPPYSKGDAGTTPNQDENAVDI